MDRPPVNSTFSKHYNRKRTQKSKSKNKSTTTTTATRISERGTTMDIDVDDDIEIPPRNNGRKPAGKITRKRKVDEATMSSTTMSTATMTHGCEGRLLIGEIATVGFYRTTPIHSFRQKLRIAYIQSLQTKYTNIDVDVVDDDADADADEDDTGIFVSDASSTKTKGRSGPVASAHTIARYNSQRLESDLLLLDWKSLCEHHDDVTNTARIGRNNETSSLLSSSSSALVEIVNPLNDPTVIPSCCRSNIVTGVFLKAIQQSPRARTRSVAGRDTQGRWTSSQTLLIEQLQQMLWNQPSASTKFVHYIENSCDFTSLSPNHTNRLLSVTFSLLNNIEKNKKKYNIFLDDTQVSKLDLVNATLSLIQQIDAMTIPRTREYDDKDGTPCDIRMLDSQPCHKQTPQHQKQLPPQKKTKSTKMTLSDLLDESIDTSLAFDAMNKNTIDLENNTFYDEMVKNNRQSTISLAGNLSSNTATASRNNDGNEWLTVRSRSYKKFAQFMIDQKQSSSLSGRSIEHDVTLSPGIIDESTVLREAVCRPQSPSLRVCLLLMAQSLDPGSPHRYFKVAELCWKGFISLVDRYDLPSSKTTKTIPLHYSMASVWLRMYTEWIGDCAVFAKNRKRCWDCFFPLVQYIKNISIESDDENDVCENEEVGDNKYHIMLKELLASVGYVLARRSRMFEDGNKDRIQVDFEDFVRHLSIHFGESHCLWLSLITNIENKDMVRSTLQRLGIFGLSGITTYSSTDGKKVLGRFLKSTAKERSIEYFKALKCWPFAQHYCLREAIQRLDGNVLSSIDGLGDVLRLLSSSVELPDDWKKDSRPSRTKKRVHGRSNIPILDGLQHNHDIFSHIFSFCGYKKLSKMEQVGKSWREIIQKDSNVLWQRAYLAEYKVLHHGLSLQGETATKDDKTPSSSRKTNLIQTDLVLAGNRTWKDLFVRKYIAEKSLANKRNTKTGFKYRTCPYVGCLCVMKSIDQERKHIQVHERNDQKALHAKKKRKGSASSPKTKTNTTASEGDSQMK